MPSPSAHKTQRDSKSSSQQKVGVVINFIESVGGTEKQIIALIQALNQENNTQFYFITCYSFKSFLKGDWSLKSKLHGFKVYRIPLLDLWGLYFIMMIPAIGFILCCLERKTKLLHSNHIFSAGVACQFIANFLSIPHCCKVMGSHYEVGDFGRLQNSFFSSTLLRIARQIPAVIALTEQIQSKLLELDFKINNIHLIPNGVDTDHFSPKHTEIDPLDLVYIGRLVEYKGLEFLLEALCNTTKPFRLHLVGDGDLKEKLIDLVKQYSLTDRVFFHGMVDDIRPYLNNRIFIFPSLTEGLSNVLLEAMSCASPILCTNIEANIPLIQDQSEGLLFKPKDTKAIAKLLESLPDRETLESLGAHAREKVIHSFSLKTIQAHYQNLYLTLGISLN